MYARAVVLGHMLQPHPQRQGPRDVYRAEAAGRCDRAAVSPSALAQGAQQVSLKRVVAAAALIGLIANFSMHLINLRMQNLGIAGSLIGLSVAVQAFAIFATALTARNVVARVGLRSTLPLSSIACAVASAAIFFSTDIVLITVLRMVFGASLTFLLIASEYIVTMRSDKGSRGYLIAWYTSALGAGTIVGPLLASMLGINEAGSFFFGASMLL